MDSVLGDEAGVIAFMRNWLMRPSLVRTQTYEPIGTSASRPRVVA
jgi:hypothetical protein